MPLQSTCPECGGPCGPGVEMCRGCRTAPLYTRLWRNVDPSGPTPARYPDLGPCWLWMGSRGSDGYGHIWGGPSMPVVFQATHVAWTFTYGPIPFSYVVCHHCDNPPCVKPTHLFIGDQRDNAADRVEKGRSRNGKPGREVVPGVAPIWWRTKAIQRAGLDSLMPLEPARQRERRTWMTRDEVQEIRWLHAQGMGYGEVAARYGVHRATISRIIRGERHAPRVPILARESEADQE